MAVLYERQENIALITLDRPGSLNAINPDLTRELGEAWQRFEQEEDAHVAILTGAGRAFCAGLDMKEAAERLRRGEASTPPGASMRMPNPRTILKPTIAAVNGAAAGGGVSFALSCDLVLASESAQFVLPFAARGRGGAPVALDLARKTSINAALYAALTAGRIDAPTALRLGICHEVLPHDDLLPRALELAEKIAGFSLVSLKSIKSALYRALDVGFAQAMREASGDWDSAVRDSKDMREGTIAFDEKRRPQYESATGPAS
ncbi:MAG TPA: enoyl-CoA hydratase-related protein [Dehalococcoidia bacterium]|nr:enoyl-CoA hydratase-related protein [Dehalococcoidia bacterium]